MNERIAVLGAGAIGASIGAYLIKNGHDVTLIDQWPAHVNKMKTDGLKLTDLAGEFTVPVKALHLCEVSNITDQFDIVYLSVKSYDTCWSTHLIEPYLKPSGFILPAQNSMNDEAVASIVGFNRTVGCVPSISSGVYEPGHVVRTDAMTIHCFTIGELFGQITPRVEKITNALSTLGPSESTTNIWGARWSKMVINCMFNALSGLLGTAALNDEQRNAAALIRVVAGCETVRVAQALGFMLEPILGIPAGEFAETETSRDRLALKKKLDSALGQRLISPEQAKKLGVPGRPSLLQDVIKGRRTEIDYLNGYVAKRGEEVGLSTPMNSAITDLTHRLEKGEIKSEPSNVERLKPYLTI